MPYDEPEPDDPQELVGVELPGDASVTLEMAAAFAEEFARLGFSRAQILALYRKAEYAGAHQAWRLLGEDAVARLVDESLAVWGRFAYVVTDCEDDEPEAQPLVIVRGTRATARLSIPETVQESEVRSQKSEVGSRKSEVRAQSTF